MILPIKHKRGTTVPLASDLVVGEIAINTDTGLCYTKTGAGNVVAIGLDVAANWGNIAGTLSSQTDLQSALDGKLDTSVAASTYYPLVGNPSNFLTSAPVTSVAGKTGVVTLDNTDISGLGTMATATAADYSTTTVANGLYYPLSGNPSGFLDSAIADTLYYSIGNPSGFITSYDADFAYYPLSGNPSSFLTASALSPYLLSSTAASTYYLQTNPAGYIPDAPSDGSQYARKDAAWEAVAASGASVTISATAPVSPSAGDLWLRSTDYRTFTWSGTEWIESSAGFLSGDRYLTTSTTSNTIGNGTKTFTIGTGLSYVPTQSVTIAYDATNHMQGEVLTYDSATGVLTVDIGYSTGSGNYPAWTVNVAGGNVVKWGAVSGTLSSQTDLQGVLDAKAPLDSPTFSGTPSLPTGTIATTQTAGDNTTALATTAFVTAALPTAASSTAARFSTNTTQFLTPNAAHWMLMNPNIIDITRAGFTVTNTGTITTTTGGWIASYTRTGTAGACSSRWRTFGASQIDQTFSMTDKSTPQSNFDFSNPSWCSGRSVLLGVTDSVFSWGFYHGKAEADGVGVLTRRGYGWRATGGAGSRFLTLEVHDGTTLTSVTSTYAVSTAAFDWDLISDGAGTVTLYVNGTQVATTTGGPTGSTNITPVVWQEEVATSAASASPYDGMIHSRGKFIAFDP